MSGKPQQTTVPSPLNAQVRPVPALTEVKVARLALQVLASWVSRSETGAVASGVIVGSVGTVGSVGSGAWLVLAGTVASPPQAVNAVAKSRVASSDARSTMMPPSPTRESVLARVWVSAGATPRNAPPKPAVRGRRSPRR